MKLPFEKIKRKILIKARGFKILKAKISAQELLACGIINLDKPKGPKSIHCGNQIKRILGIKKAGHSGTLDPIATGVLPIGISKGVKVLAPLTEAGKVYQGKFKLHSDVSLAQVKNALKAFTGKIVQLPPRISAVARIPREREVYWFKLKKKENRVVEFEISCEAGTYIRKLIHDLGLKLKVGAHLFELRRIQSGPLKIKKAVSIEQVRKNYEKWLKTKDERYIKKIILPPAQALAHLPKVWIKPDVVERFAKGSPIFVPGIVQLTEMQKGEKVCIFDLNSRLLGLGVAQLSSDEILQAEKGLAIKTDVVLI